MRELNDSEFHATFAEPMRELKEGEVGVTLPLAEFVAEAIHKHQLPTTVEDIEIHHVYENGTGTYTHVLFWYGIPNVYLVAVIHHTGPSLYGYHVLDLNAKYGLNEPTAN
jgi:hypothetical protein